MTPEAITILRRSSHAPLGRVCAVIRPGARYAVHRHADSDGFHGRWLPDAEPAPRGLDDAFTFDEARLLLPLLRSIHARGGGRPAAKPTTAHGKLVARAQRRTGLTLAVLGPQIGAHPTRLSRVLAGTNLLTAEQHEKLVRLLAEEQAS